jgi:hypothetical protein
MAPRERPSHNLLQSGGGSLHLPLLQNGAGLFPSTPLLRVLRLVTHTVREIGPMRPRLRIVAVSMQRLEVRHALQDGARQRYEPFHSKRLAWQCLPPFRQRIVHSRV